MPLKWIFQMFKPKNIDEAALLKKRFAMLYAFIGWNFAALAFYTVYRENIPSDEDKQREALITGFSRKKDVRYIRIDQTSVVEDKVIPKTGVTSKPEISEEKEQV